ncbi:TPA: RAQPRD family integrative conjugative element protein [Legionella pneumophila]|uniref:Conjugal transfer protein n=1 Tax=Legionella pneumophila TaxID=446 RepID=A0A378K8K5_LEGPN|nr:RAQPRD family integrative conjugative element protein [Legionella pneumophila]MCZ4682012.1 RAQPRD family integrative conjugative element protein [Legionella pneumophila]MCZ4689335.1 RAQPRD family integrative conjugative element protein [Legionella pneumophila]MCZ4708108.1 RAQPRD family integrative conjugative element protein [Legionella pneumophila]MCZ4717286.1 RAQPRD family integrative conjugative element protein [Legionella pneumophila]MCZ4738620.1 RAQPRD family integrative conjugative el
MKRLLCLTLMILSLNSWANNPDLNETLVRIINQINAIMPLLDEAQTQLTPNTRIQLQIEGFEDAQDQHHAGVREDLLNIRNGLIDYINQPIIAPRKITPLEMDFVRKP